MSRALARYRTAWPDAETVDADLRGLYALNDGVAALIAGVRTILFQSWRDDGESVSRGKV